MATFNLGTILEQNALRFPKHPSVITPDRSFTWEETNHRVNALARSLAVLGVKARDRVLVQARNSYRAFEIKWACFKLGATWVPVNYRLTPPEIAFMAGHCQPMVLVFDGEFEEHRLAARAKLDIPPVCISLDARHPDCLLYDDLVVQDHAVFREAEVEADHPAWFFYTSGTTGRPKAAILTHGQLAFVIASQLADMFPGTTELDTSLVIAPLSHGAGVHALAHVARGATQVIMTARSVDPETVWATIERYHVTNFFAVPTLIKTLVEHPAVDVYHHGSLRHVNYGGAPMLLADQRVALAKLGKALVQHYGLGEFTANITVLPPHMHEAGHSTAVGSCGYARTGVEIGILSADGRRLRSGETGEICARGQAAFLGYYGNEEATAKAFAGGWFHTGDLGYLDSQGLLYITGRASDMYISGGVNVYPREIEEIILADDRINEVAVVGVPHEKWGECGAAVVVARPDSALKPEDITAMLSGRVAKFKHPHHVVFWPELPKSGYGKILKNEIKTKLVASLTADGLTGRGQ